MAAALMDGFATANSNAGYSRFEMPNGSFALGDDGELEWGLIEDFAFRAQHKMTVVGKAVTEAFYGEPPQFAYFNGCSTGGRQGLMEAQRFPDDYDGILAGAPAIHWDRFLTAELWPQVVMQEEVGQQIAVCKFETVNQAVVEACDSLDGIVDGIIDDPRRCDVDLREIQCPEDTDGTECDCLTPQEIEAVYKIWDGPRSADGERLWFGLEPSASLRSLAGASPFGIALNYHRYWVKQDPEWDWRTLDYGGFEETLAQSTELFRDVIGTDDPDLSDFRDAGGKLLLWHGWDDELIFPRGTIDYYERVLDTMGGPKRVHGFARLFMAPGISHCHGGPGPSVFDGMTPLVKWVEEGVAPERISTSSRPNQVVDRTRTLCVYPKVARWSGEGSTDVADNFVCQLKGLDRADHASDFEHGQHGRNNARRQQGP